VGVGIVEAGEEGFRPAAQRFGEDSEQGQDEKQHEEAHRERDQRPAHQAAFAEDAVRHDRTSAG
jgi:hypothetical protein